MSLSKQTEQQTQKETDSFLDLKEFISQEIKDVKGIIHEKYDTLNKNFQTAVESISGAVLKVNKKVDEIILDVEIKSKQSDLKFTEVDGKIEKMDNEITMMQFRFMEYAIRLRGIKENNREDLRKICADALAILLKCDPEEIFYKMDKVYRVNSRVAAQRQLPRDVVIYFTDRRIRNDILQKSFFSAVQIDGNEVGVFKELPPKMLKDRRDFGFLVAELRKRQIQFRWDVPFGVILRFEGERYRLNTIAKAEDFYYNVLKMGLSPRTSSPVEVVTQRQFDQEIVEQTRQRQKERVIGGLAVDGSGSFLNETSKTVIEEVMGAEFQARQSQEQRITRSVAKQIQETKQQGKSQPQQTKKIKGKGQTEVVGGAKPKIISVEKDLQQLLSTLQTSLKDA